MAVDRQVARLVAIDVQALGAFVTRLKLRVPPAGGEVAAVSLEPESVWVGTLFPFLGDVDDHLRCTEVRASPTTEPDRAEVRARLRPRMLFDDVAVLVECRHPSCVAVTDDAVECHATTGLGPITTQTL
jgi:hypothetical protein